MKPTVYIESSIVSYLTAKPSRDIVLAAHQQITYDWWQFAKPHFEMYSSQITINEISAGDAEAANRRLDAIKGISLLDVNAEVTDLAKRLLSQGALPEKASLDALHIAVAAVHQMQYLLTWNCKHIANAVMRPTIERIIHDVGFIAPIIATPEELQGE
jgi:predicted nucleic acid-binding protein